MLNGFKQFVLRGNVVDLAVGVVIGASFGAIINSLVKDIVMPLIGALVQFPDLSNHFLIIRENKFAYGSFINAVLTFLITATAIYFGVVTPVNTLIARVKKSKTASEPTNKKCPECLSEIPIAARRCAHCTSILTEGK